MSLECADENMRPLGCELPDSFSMKILDGTVVELETTQSITSKELKSGDAISLRVASPVLAEGVELIAADTVTIGVITTIDKCGCCDLPSQIFLNINKVATVNGPSISLDLSVRPVRSEHSQAIDHEMAAAALMFPAAALAVALFATQRKYPVVRLERRFRALVCGDIEVRALGVRPEERR